MHNPSAEELDELQRRSRPNPEAADLFEQYVSMLAEVDQAVDEEDQRNLPQFEAEATRLRAELEKLI